MKGEKIENAEFIANLRLEMIFSKFREEEKITKGPLTESFHFNAIDIYRILLNRCHKKYLGVETSDLEKVIASEAGKFIRAYVKSNYNDALEQYHELGHEVPETVPYPCYDITLDDIKSRVDTYMKTRVYQTVN